MIIQKAEAAGVKTNLALFLAENESNFDPLAKNPSSTATGLFQILIGTWKNFDCEGERTDPEDNTDCAMRILTSPHGLSHWQADPIMRAKLLKEGFQ